MGYSVDILNSIRANASTEYQERIPEATQTNIAAIGQAFETYDMVYNEFCDKLIHKIGRTILEQNMFENKLAKFKSGGIVSPHDVEEIFVEMASAEGPYDPTGANALGRREELDIKVMYHRENRRDMYAISLGDIDFAKVFRSEATLDAFLLAKLNAVYSGDAYDEWLAMKNILATYEGYDVCPVKETTDKKTFAVSFVKSLRKVVNDLTFASREHNAAKVRTWSKPSELTLFVHKDVVVEVDVEQLASAFHQSNTDMKVVPEIIIMDDFGSLGDTYAVLADKSWLKVWDTKFTTESIRNPKGLFTNYFLHHHQILSASKFKNAVRFSKTTA